MTQFLFEGKYWDLLYAYQFIKRLVIPFDKTDAFKLGIIDKYGNNLIPRKDFTTDEQKNAYTYFTVMVFNLKKLLGKLPAGKTMMASLIAALLLLKEEKNRTFHIEQENDEKLLIEKYKQIYDKVHSSNTNFIPILTEIHCLIKEDKMINEEVTGDLPTLQIPTSTVGALRRKQKKDAMIRRAPVVYAIPEGNGVESHGDFKVFTVDTPTFIEAKSAKNRYNKYDKYVGRAELGEQIRSYAISNPNMPVILKCETTGQICFLKYGKVSLDSITEFKNKK